MCINNFIYFYPLNHPSCGGFTTTTRHRCSYIILQQCKLGDILKKQNKDIGFNKVLLTKRKNKSRMWGTEGREKDSKQEYIIYSRRRPP